MNVLHSTFLLTYFLLFFTIVPFMMEKPYLKTWLTINKESLNAFTLNKFKPSSKK